MTTRPKSKAAYPTVEITQAAADNYRKAAGKKPCKNCPRWFKPRAKGGSPQLFCSEDCRKEFHHNGAAFGKLREAIPKMIAREVERRIPEIIEQIRAEFRGAARDSFIERGEIGADGLALLRRAVERSRKLRPQTVAKIVAHYGTNYGTSKD